MELDPSTREQLRRLGVPDGFIEALKLELSRGTSDAPSIAGESPERAAAGTREPRDTVLERHSVSRPTAESPRPITLGDVPRAPFPEGGVRLTEFGLDVSGLERVSPELLELAGHTIADIAHYPPFVLVPGESEETRDEEETVTEEADECCEVTGLAFENTLDRDVKVRIDTEDGTPLDAGVLRPGGQLAVARNLGRCFRLTLIAPAGEGQTAFAWQSTICCADLVRGRVELPEGVAIVAHNRQPCTEEDVPKKPGGTVVDEPPLPEEPGEENGNGEPPPPEEPPDIPPEELPPPGGPAECEVIGSGTLEGPGSSPVVIALPVIHDTLRPASIQEAPRNGPYDGFGVHLGDGAFTHDHVDLEIRSLSFDFAFRRHYNSNVQYDGSLGLIWDFDYNRRLVERPRKGLGVEGDRYFESLTTGRPEDEGAARGNPPRDIYYYDGRGRRYAYEFHEAEMRKCNLAPPGTEFEAYVSTYVSPPGRLDQLLRYVVLGGINPYLPNHVIFYLLRYKDGSVEVFDCLGRLLRLIDNNGNFMAFEYEGEYNPSTKKRVLSRIVDTGGRSYEVKQERLFGSDVPRIVRVTVEAPAAGRNEPATRHRKKEIIFRYKPLGQNALLEEVETPGGARDRYEYDGEKLRTIKNPRETALKGPPMDGAPWLVNFYGEQGKVKFQTVGDAYAGALPPGTTPERARAKRFGGGTVEFQRNGNEVTVADVNGGLTKYEITGMHGSAVATKRTVAGDVEPRMESTTVIQYNDDFQIRGMDLPGGGRREFGYETENRILRGGERGAESADVREDVEDNIVWHNDLGRGNLLSVTHYPAPDEDGFSAQPITVKRGYERLHNQLDWEEDEHGRRTSYRYPDHGSFGAWYLNGNTSTLEYPDLTRADGEVLKDIRDTRTYNQFGLLRSIADPLKQRTAVLSHHALSGQPRLLQHANNESEESTYDFWGNLLTHRNVRGVITKYEHDDRDRVERKIEDFGESPAKLNHNTVYRYDLNDNLTGEEAEWKDNFTASGHPALDKVPEQSRKAIRGWKHDLLGRLTEESTEETGKLFKTTYRYLDEGRVSLSEPLYIDSPFEGVTRHVIDMHGLVRQTTRGSAVQLFLYDEKGSCVLHRDALQNWTKFRFDGFGRPIGQVDAAGNTRLLDLDAKGATIRERVFGHPGGPTPAPPPDSQRWPLLSEREFDLDEHGNIRREIKHVWSGVSADRFSLSPERVADLDVIAKGRSQDALDRLVEEFAAVGIEIPPGFGDTVLLPLAGKGWLLLDNLRHAPYVLVPGEQGLAVRGAATTSYWYDKADRQIAEVGDRGHRTDYGFDARNRPTSMRDPLGNEIIWTPDGNGNVVMERSLNVAPEGTPGGAAEDRTLAKVRGFDARDRLISETNLEGITTRTFYDSLGNIRVKVDGRNFARLYSWDVMARPREELWEWCEEGCEKRGDKQYTLLKTEHEYEFTKTGRIHRTTSPEGGREQHFDDLGRLRKAFYRGKLMYEVLRYDLNDNPTRTQDANRTLTVNTYDALNRRVQRIFSSLRPRLGVRQEIVEYDGLSRRTAAGASTRPVTDSARGDSGYAGFEYDSLDRVIAETQTSQFTLVKKKLTPWGLAQHVVRTIYGGAHRTVHFQRYAVRHDLDEIDRVKSIVLTGPPSNEQRARVDYGYSGRGNVGIRTYSNETETCYFRDRADRLHGIVHGGPGGVRLYHPRNPGEERPSAFNQAQRTRKSPLAAYFIELDANGNSSRNLVFHLDSRPEPKSWTIEHHTYTHDSLDRVLDDNRAEYPSAEYDLIQTLLAIVSKVSPTLRPLGTLKDMLVRIGARTGSIKLVARHKYTESGARVRSEWDEEYAPVGPGTLTPKGRKFVVEREPEGGPSPERYKNVTVAGDKHEYDYDDNGNLISDANNRYFYDALDRLVRVESKPGWSGLPGTARHGAITSVDYIYDPLDRLILKRDKILRARITTAESRTWSYLYSGEQCLHEQVGGITPATRGVTYYLWGAEPGELVAFGNFGKAEDLRFLHEGLFRSIDYSSGVNKDGTVGFRRLVPVRIGGHFYPSTARERALWFHVPHHRYEAAFEGHVMRGVPLFSWEAPERFARREEGLVELQRQRNMVNDWILARLTSGPVGNLVYFIGALGYIAADRTSPEDEAELELVAAAADLLGPPGPFDLLPGGTAIQLGPQGMSLSEFCLCPGTLVLTGKGLRPVESIAVGDAVLSRDDATGEQGLRRVVWVCRNHTEVIVAVEVGRVGSAPDGAEEPIRCTPEHPWFVEGRGWCEAATLRAGDRLRATDGAPVEVRSVIVHPDASETYNLEVEGWHTYFVAAGACGPTVWLHNANGVAMNITKLRLLRTLRRSPAPRWARMRAVALAVYRRLPSRRKRTPSIYRNTGEAFESFSVRQLIDEGFEILGVQMNVGFARRARRIDILLRDPRTGVILALELKSGTTGRTYWQKILDNLNRLGWGGRLMGARTFGRLRTFIASKISRGEGLAGKMTPGEAFSFLLQRERSGRGLAVHELLEIFAPAQKGISTLEVKLDDLL